MSDKFIIKNVLPFSEKSILTEGLFLLILRADCAPPHLIMMINGTCFDLGFKGPSIRNDCDALLAMIKSKSVKAIFISLKWPQSFSHEEIHKKMKELVFQYDGLNTSNKILTCLAPIKEFCAWAYQINCIDVNFIFDLLPILYDQRIVGKAYYLNMQEMVIDNTIILNKYTRQDIDNRIRELHLLEGNKNI